MKLLLAALVLLCVDFSHSSCLDNSGKAVSWFFTYKMPNGYQNAYTDEHSSSSKVKGTLELFERDLDDEKEPVALIRTLLALESSSSNATRHRLRGASHHSSTSDPGYLLYNDEPDKGTASSSYGHTKGVLAITSSGGFWVVHSTPKWPQSSNTKGRFYFPESETIYGQTFLCVTLTKTQVDDVAKQLLYNTPFVYKNTISDAQLKEHPAVADVINKNWVSGAGANSKKIGRFTSFAKNAAWNDDLWAYVGKSFKSDMLVETWLRGSKEGSYCRPKHKYEVMDVQSMAISDGSGGNITWSETQDHAKWGVALSGNTNIVCIGDINRMTTQRNRGGGAVCFDEASLASRLYNSVVTSYSCKK